MFIEWQCTDCDEHGEGVTDSNAERAQAHADAFDHLVHLKITESALLTRRRDDGNTAFQSPVSTWLQERMTRLGE